MANVDGDGLLDLAGGISSTPQDWRNPDYTHEQLAPYWHDVNSDGNLDRVTGNYQARSYTLLMGIGDGTFENTITIPKGLRLRDGKWGPQQSL